MAQFKVKVKWGKEVYPDVSVDTSEEPLVLKAQLFALTGVQPHRQKVMLKGQTVKDDTWANIKIKDGATLLMMGSKEEDIPSAPTEKTKFVEDMDEAELQHALEMPLGLQNLGNTCYMNATIQCLKTVKEFKSAVLTYAESMTLEDPARGITAALRDQYKAMEAGRNMPPIVLLQVLHQAFPRFAETSEHGGYQQQDANECWVELLGLLKQKLPSVDNPKASSVIEQYFGLQFDTETKCVETEDEAPSKATEHFLQYNCYIDKDVKYLMSGLKNRLQESLTKHSSTLDRDAEYIKKLKVSRLPAYLTVQMVRFQFKQKDAINAKILKDVKFPEMLDTFELCTDELQQRLIPMRTKFKEHEDRVVEESSKLKAHGGKEAAIKKDRKEAEKKECHPFHFEDDLGSNNSGYYELQAVLTHKGRSSNSGHYVAWVKQDSDTWIELNDDDVRPVHPEDILKLSGGGDWHTAYLLIYGPRRLPKEEEQEGKKKEEGEEEAEKKAEAKEDATPMET